MRVVIKAVQLEGVSMSSGNVNGQWLKSFDPDAFNGGGDAQWTNKLDEAKVFRDFNEAFVEWKRQSTVRPLRADGKPNRPLTAFTVTFDTVP